MRVAGVARAAMPDKAMPSAGSRDYCALLSELGDARSVPEEELSEPDLDGPARGKAGAAAAAGRTYAGKEGIGNLGVPLDTAAAQLTAKVLGKTCQFCSAKAGDEDPLNGSLTMAWSKPSYGGRCCAHCAITVRRRYPAQDLAPVAKQVQTSPDAHAAFTNFRTWMLDEYKSGNKRVKDAVERSPQEQVNKQSEFAIVKKDTGIMKLLSAYVEQHGDPDSNGKGHTKVKTMWKDGTLREAVLIPTTAEDEMECSWQSKSGYVHTKCLDDGALSMDGKQQQELFGNLLAAKGASKLTGDRYQSHRTCGATPDLKTTPGFSFKAIAIMRCGSKLAHFMLRKT